MNTVDPMELFGAMRRINGLTHRFMKKTSCGTPLKGYHLMYLVRLESCGPQAARDLSHALDADKGHTSRVLSDLISYGYVEKSGPERMASLSLTDEGRKLASHALSSIRELDLRLRQAVSQEDLEAFLRVLDALSRSLDADCPPRALGGAY